MNQKDNVLPISIVIPAKNEAVSIGKLFRDIRNQTHQPTEVILADAQSEDHTRDIAEEFNVKIVEGGLPSVGRNRGAKAATQETIVFLDADVRLENTNTLFNTYTKYFDKKSVFLSGGYKPFSNNKNFLDVAISFIVNTVERLDNYNPFFTTCGGAFIVVDKKTFFSVGGFDEKLRYVEDGDFADRMKRSGFSHDTVKEYVNLSYINNNKGHGDRNPFELKAVLLAPLAMALGVIGVRLKNGKWFNKLGVKLNSWGANLYGTLGGIVKYENPHKPKDREGGYPKGITRTEKRFYEILQGLMFWLFLLAPVIFGLLGWDIVFVIYLAFLLSYWAFRAIKLAIGVGVGYKRFEEETNKDWMNAIKEEGLQDLFDVLKFIYLCPVYNEDFSTLDLSFKSYAESSVGSKKIDVVMAIEEKKQEKQIENFKRLKEKYGNEFNSMKYYIHPAGIPGEVAGVKGANINWAARHFVKELESEGMDIRDYLLITCDSDQRVHPKYLAAVAYKYLTAEDPDMQYYSSAVHTFQNNVLNAPILVRAESNMLTMGQLYAWVMAKKVTVPFSDEEIYIRDTFSAYIVNLKTLHDFEYWDPEIANDDTAFYWNAMVRSKGKFKSQEVYIPTYNDAVENETIMKTYISFYKQQHRWGWGAINVPITWAAMAKDRDNFPLYRKLAMTSSLVEYQIWFLTVVMMFTFGVQIMNWLSPTFRYSAYSVNLPNLLGVIFTGITLLNIPLIYYRRKIMPVPKNWSIFRHLVDFGETYLMTVNMLTFKFIPFIQAKTEILLGKSDKMRNFYVTEKVKIKKSKS